MSDRDVYPTSSTGYHRYVIAALVMAACCVCGAGAAGSVYHYDDLGRLIRIERADCTVIDYTYDAVGNRLSRTVVNDRDCDAVRDALDCAPLDPGASALPLEATTLTIALDTETLSWTSVIPAAGSGTLHELIRGSLPGLPVGSDPGETCLISGTPEAMATDNAIPAPGEGYWYLARGRNTCGPGSLGFESGGAERITGVCP